MHKTMIYAMNSRDIVRCGFAGESTPRYREFSFIGSLYNSTADDELYGLLQEKFLQLFIEKLKVKPQACRVLMIEHMLAPRHFRQALFTTLL